VTAGDFGFVGRLITMHIRPGWAKTVEAFGYNSKRVGVIAVEPGFEFDWDSVPRIPGLHVMVKGRAEKSACIHDWLYRRQITSRKMADVVFMDAMKHEGVKRRHRWPIYWGVRIGGWRGWNRYARA
jgi:hypothetical protein